MDDQRVRLNAGIPGRTGSRASRGDQASEGSALLRLQRLVGNRTVQGMMLQRQIAADAPPPAQITVDAQSVENWLNGGPTQSYYGVMHVNTGMIYLGPGTPITRRADGASGGPFHYTPAPDRGVLTTGIGGQGGHGGLIYSLGNFGPGVMAHYCGFSLNKGAGPGSSKMAFRSGLNDVFDWQAAGASPGLVSDIQAERWDRAMPPEWATAIENALQVLPGV